jgi:hypothetical protein
MLINFSVIFLLNLFENYYVHSISLKHGRIMCRVMFVMMALLFLMTAY